MRWWEGLVVYEVVGGACYMRWWEGLVVYEVVGGASCIVVYELHVSL